MDRLGRNCLAAIRGNLLSGSIRLFLAESPAQGIMTQQGTCPSAQQVPASG
jgi:hypothetical protein